MKKNAIYIFGRIWFFWFVCSFFIIVIICYPLIIFSSKKLTPKNVVYISFIYRICTTFFCTLGAFRIHIVGKQNYNKKQRYIIVANHRSVMDIPMLIGLFRIRIIGKDTFFTKVPFFSIYYKRGTVLIDRKSRTSRSQGFEKMKNVLSHNISMAIYPEGTRNRTNQSVLNFHNGAFKLAKETGTPILPIVLFNTDQAVSTTKRFFAMPTQINIHILQSVNPNEFETMEQLREAIHQRIKNEYEQYSEILKKKNLLTIES